MRTEERVQLLSDRLGKLIAKGATAQALTVARQLTRLQPEAPDTWRVLGDAWLAMGDLPEAESCVRRALEVRGDDFQACDQLSTIHWLRADMDGAIAWGLRAVKCKPDEASVYLRLADAFRYRGQPEEAIKFAQKAVKTAAVPQEQLAARLLLGRHYLTMSAFAKAAAQFRAVVKGDATNVEAQTNLGHCQERLGRGSTALDAFRQASAVAPGDPECLYNLGDAYLAAGQPELAIGPLMQAVQLQPSFSLAFYDLSLAYFELERYPEGAAAARAALRGDERMETQRINLGLGATGNLGICLLAQGKLKEALACFDRNLRLLGPTYFNRGLTLFRMGRFQEAVTAFERALELEPDEAEYLDLLGQSYSGLGQLKVGERWLRRAIKVDPTYAAGHYDLGVWLAKKSETRKQAQRCFERALTLDPDMVWATYALACLHAVFGKKTEALTLLEKALENGFREFDHMKKDRDLDGLRNTREYRQLVAKYRES